MRNIFFVCLASILIISSVFVIWLFSDTNNVDYGATVSFEYSDYLEVDWFEVLKMSHEEIGISNFRIPVYWSRHEIRDDVFSFSDLDKMFSYASQNNLNITLAIGHKVPRWPECFPPSWTDEYSDEDFESELIEFISTVVGSYDDETSLVRWQLENEAYFPFGDCRSVSELFRYRAYSLLRELSDKPIQTTVSGEQSLWISRAGDGDYIGASLYRTVATPVIGRWTFPHTPLFYRFQSKLLTLIGRKVIISELQAEPWGLHEFNLTETAGRDASYLAYDANQLDQSIRFAKSTGIGEVYFWGVEWWYKLRSLGEPGLVNKARDIVLD